MLNRRLTKADGNWVHVLPVVARVRGETGSLAAPMSLGFFMRSFMSKMADSDLLYTSSAALRPNSARRRRRSSII